MMTKEETPLPMNLGILLKRFLAIFLLLSGLTGIFLMGLYYAEVRIDRKVIEDAELYSVNLQMRTIATDFKSIVAAGKHLLSLIVRIGNQQTFLPDDGRGYHRRERVGDRNNLHHAAAGECKIIW